MMILFFTYFFRRPFKLYNFYKVDKNSLARINYKSINGDDIRQNFYYQIIPVENRSKQTSSKCGTSVISFDYKYKYIDSENAPLVAIL